MSGPVRAALLALLHEDAGAAPAARLEDLEPEHWQQLLTLAAEQRVRPLVHARLLLRGAQAYVPAGVWDALERATRQTAARSLRAQTELANLARTLNQRGIPMVVLKGMYLAEAVYQNAALREMNDIDVLVHREHLAAAVGALTDRGYAGVQPFLVDLDAAASHQVTELHMPGVAFFEVHWNITKVNQPFSIDPGPLWERVRPFEVAGVSMMALAPEDTLLHACVHASYHHRFEFGLRPLCDIAGIVRVLHDEFDWPTFIERSRGWRWDRGCYLALRLARVLIGAAVPDAVLQALAPADADDAVDAAREQVFTSPSLLVEMGGELSQLTDGRSSASGVAHIGSRLFLSRQQLAAFYAVRPDSPWIWWCYVLRLGYLMRRYGRIAAKTLVMRDPAAAEAAARKNVIRRWLEP